MGTSRGLFPWAKGTPENHTGDIAGRIVDGKDASIGITETGSLRSGKNEIKGVPGGGRIRENSAASEESGVCLGERPMRRFVPPDTISTRDWGVISLAKSGQP
jgi:hypothetical protein